MADTKSLNSTHLFTVRLWPEDLGGGQAEWRGKVLHVTSGEAHYLRLGATIAPPSSDQESGNGLA